VVSATTADSCPCYLMDATRIDAGPQVWGVRGSVHSTVPTRQDAERIYRDLQSSGQIRVLARRSLPSRSATYVSQAPVQQSRSPSGHGNGHATNDPRNPTRPLSKGLAREPSLLFSPDEPVEDAFRRVKISNDAHPSPDQPYRDDRRVKVERLDSGRRPQPLVQSHSWPTTRQASPDERKPATGIIRSHSDNLDQPRRAYVSVSAPVRRRDERESGSKSSSSSTRSKTSGIIVGNPGHLKPFTANVGRTPASAPPGGLGSPHRVATSPSISASRRGSSSTSSRHITLPEEQMSISSPPGRIGSDMSSPSRPSKRSSRSSTSIKTETTGSPMNSPREQATPSGSSFTESRASLPSHRCKEYPHRSPSVQSSSPPSNISLGDIGFSPAHAPYSGYSPKSDIRSPIPNRLPIPLGRK
jgi:hypothetical protein